MLQQTEAQLSKVPANGRTAADADQLLAALKDSGISGAGMAEFLAEAFRRERPAGFRVLMSATSSKQKWSEMQMVLLSKLAPVVLAYLAE